MEAIDRHTPEWLAYRRVPSAHAYPFDATFPRNVHDAVVTRAFSSAADLVLWARALPQHLQDEILFAGAVAAIARAKRQYCPVMAPEIRARRASDRQAHYADNAATWARLDAEAAVFEQKAKILDRLVELLDCKLVAGKPLGDCKRADLLREAHRLEAFANEATLDAGLYRDIAGLIGACTVREYSDRAGVVALLTSRWGEEAEAA